jgi:hypothetical protein
MVLGGEQVVLGWITAGFFALGPAVFLWQLIDPRPRLIIDEHGIYDRTFGVGWIAWSDIDDAYMHSTQGVEFICLRVLDPSSYLGKLSWVRRRLAEVNRALGFTEFNVCVSGLRVSAEEVFRLVQRYLHEL